MCIGTLGKYWYNGQPHGMDRSSSRELWSFRGYAMLCYHSRAPTSYLPKAQILPGSRVSRFLGMNEGNTC